MAPSPIRVQRKRTAATPIFKPALKPALAQVARYVLLARHSVMQRRLELGMIVRVGGLLGRHHLLPGLRLRIGATRLAAFASRFRGERTILGEAALFGRHRFTAFASCLRSKRVVLGEASL